MSAAERLVGQIDLREQPWSLPGSRLVVSEAIDGLQLALAEYERPLSACRVAEGLHVAAADGRALPVMEVEAHALRYALGGSLTFDGPRAVSLGGFSSAVVVRLTARAAVVADIAARVGAVSWAVSLPHAERATVTVDGDAHLDHVGTTVQVSLPVGAALVIALDGGLGSDAPGPELGAGHAGRLARTRAVWQDWMGRCPVVIERYADVTALCWWVLGGNQVVLERHGGEVSVVPSLQGYVAHWQWDAYFTAIGLAHGAPELARAQLDLALSRPGADGQLPDVLSDDGILASPRRPRSSSTRPGPRPPQVAAHRSTCAPPPSRATPRRASSPCPAASAGGP